MYSSGSLTCIEEYEYGFDWIRTFKVGTTDYCFKQVEVTGLKPDDDLKGKSTCVTLSDLIWKNTNNSIPYDCVDDGIERPGGTTNNFDITLFYDYR